MPTLLTTRQSEEDTIYEQDILRDPGTVKPWLAYIEFKFQHGSLHEQAFVLERACRQLPRSYKLWKMVILVSPRIWIIADIVVVFDAQDKAPREVESRHLCFRICQSQLSFRTSINSTQQNAPDMGNVPFVPFTSANCHAH